MQTTLTPPKTAPDPNRLDLSRIAQDLQIRKLQVESVVQLLDEGNTVPFITRYRKERTGNLDEEQVRIIQARVVLLRQLAERKQTILKSIEGQGKLTDELRHAILIAETPKRLEDLYLPHKPKKRSLATTARERGLEPLAQAIWSRDPAVANLGEILPTMVNTEKELNTPEDVLTGVQHILAEQIAETAEIRANVRFYLWDHAQIVTSKSEKVKEGEGLGFEGYFQFKEAIRTVPPHRILAINRGEKEHVLIVKLEFDHEAVQRIALDRLPLADHPHADLLRQVTVDALERLLLPSLEREIRRELKDHAEDHAARVFARNLRSLLLGPPLRNRRVLAIDPGFRNGCKLAALDEFGNLLEHGVVFPHQPQNKKPDARRRLEELVRKHQLSVIAIGNGTACRETEELVSELIASLEARRGQPPGASEQLSAVPTPEPARPAPATETPPAPVAEQVPPPVSTTDQPAPLASVGTPEPPPAQPTGEGQPPIATDQPAPPAPEAKPAPPPPPTINLEGLPEAPADLAYVIVNEAGASDYSVSPLAREEFPDITDPALRGTASIGRRLQDPLSELVKIDPQHVGVGLYQHDVSSKHLKEMLEGVIESCVNTVGVDVNTASVPLLRHVSGMNQLVAHDLVEFRKANGPFRERSQLMQVNGIGEARFTQAAGFLKIAGGDNPLDRTWIHPESYGAANQLLAELGCGPEVLNDRERIAELRGKLRGIAPDEVAARLNVGTPTLRDIIEALSRPGRDPREDLPPPVFKKGVLKLEDLQPAMELKGTVLNVVDFGAFVDIGLKDSGLVHISQMANRYVKSPYDVVAVGDVVTVWVLSVDSNRRRVSLTMIRPGTERKPPERRPPSREPREQGPPRERGRGQRPQGQQTQQAQQGQQGQQGQEQRQGQGQGPPRGGERRLPPRGGRRPGQGPGRGGQSRPAPAQAEGQTGETAGAQPAAGAAPQQGQTPPPPPRKPRRQPPKPQLSQAALAGSTPLGTFAELAAYWEAAAKPAQEKTPPPPPAEPEPPKEEQQAPPPENG